MQRKPSQSSLRYLELRSRDGQIIPLDPDHPQFGQRPGNIGLAYTRPDLWTCVCVCRGAAMAPLPTTVFERRKKYQVAKHKNDGPLHHVKCFRHSLDPQMLKDCGWSERAIKRNDGTGQFEVQLAFGMTAADEISERADSSWPNYWSGSSSRRNSITLGGLFSFWLELAGFTYYTPRDGSTASPEFGHSWVRAFRDAAMLLKLPKQKGSEWGLANKTLLPNSPEIDWTANNMQALAQADRQRVFAVLEVNAEMLEAAEDCIDLSQVFGVPVELHGSTLARGFKSFPSGRASINQGRRTLMFLLCTARRGPNKTMRAEVERVCLQPLTPEGLPCGSLEEHDLLHGLAVAQRSFRVFLRCDENYHGKRPDAELLDTAQPRPIEIFGFTSDEYRKQMPERLAWYEAKFPGLLFYWDCAVESVEDALRRLAVEVQPVRLIT